MRKGASLLLAAGMSLAAGPAAGELCTLDVVPAATLLLPHFAVDMAQLGKPKRTETTTVVLKSTDAVPQIVRVTLWTDLAVPTVAFDLLLSNGIRKIPVHEIFRGNLPPAGVPADLDNGLCAADGLVDPEDLQDAHAGREVAAYGGRCAGFAHGDRVARGYITIDNVSACSDLFPGDAGYFGSGGVAANGNVLHGVVRNDNRRQKYAEIEPLVHIEAGQIPGTYTFYGRYVGYDGRDRREPLGVVWDAFFDIGGGSATQLEVWRDSGAIQEPFQCDRVGAEGWYPLGEGGVSGHSEVGEFFAVNDVAAGPAHLFPAESGSYHLGSGKLVLPHAEGSIALSLTQGPTSTRHQSYVSVRQSLESGRRRGRSQAALLVDACGNSHPGNVTPIP